MAKIPFLTLHLFAAPLIAAILLTACQPEARPSGVFTSTSQPQTIGTADPTTGVTEQAPATQPATEINQNSSDQVCNFTEKVQFPVSGTSFLASGVITPAEKHCFLLQAGANQLLTVSASSAEDNMMIDVFIEGGMAAVVSQSLSASQWIGLLPASQEYLVVLTTKYSTADYFLSIELPANLSLEPPQNSLEIDGKITVNSPFHPDIFTRVRYRLYVPAGQTLSVNLVSPDPSDLSLGIYGELDGQPYKRFEILGNHFSLEIPVSQFYYIDIYGISGADSPFILQLHIAG